jgi:hypothetical protein
MPGIGRLNEMGTTNTVTVNVGSLLRFYDEDREVRRHSNAIKMVAGEELGFALLIEYFRRVGVTAKLLTRPCTTGSSKGSRLDGWIEATSPETSTCTYYQVEVKSWSIHGVGGDSKPLSLAAKDDELAAYKKRLWNSYWANGQFVAPNLNKVLTPMRGELSWALVEPLACVWSALHPEGKQEELFSVPLISHSRFQRVWVFSMSSFLRNIVHREPQIALNLPCTAARMRWLNTLFTLSPDAQQLIPADPP